MIGVVISGHGNFASGLLSCATVILGPQENVVAVDFVANDSGETLQEKILRAIDEMQCDSIVFLTDIAGGTPFNQSVLVSQKIAYSCKVFSGTNIPLILELLLGCHDSTVDMVTKDIFDNNKASVRVYEKRNKVKSEAGVEGI